MTPHLAAVAAVVLVVGSTCVVADSVAGLRGVVRFANSSAEQQLWDGPEGVAVHADVIVAPGIPALTWSALTEVGGLFELRGLPSCRDVVLRSDAVSWGVEQPVTARTPCPESGSLAFPAALIATRAPVSGHVRSRTAGGAAPIGGVAVAVSVEGSSAPPVRVRTLADGSYSTAGAAPGFPLGSVVTVAVDAAAAAEAGIDAFEAGDGTARFRLGPGPHGEAPSADLAPVPMSARVLAALASALPKRVAALLPAPPEPEWRLAAPAFVAATYAVCGVIHGENVRHLHAGGDIARSVRLFSADPVTNGWAETGSRVGSAFAAAPLRRAAALTAQDAARFLWQKYSAAARSEGPLSSRGPQEFCLRGIPPGTFAVVPAVTPPEAAGGIRVEPAGFFVTAGPQLHSRAPAAAAAATSALRFDVVAPSLSGTVAGLAPLPAPAQGGDTAKVQVVFQVRCRVFSRRLI